MKDINLLLLLFSICCGKITGIGPPGKPTLTNCRSPEKETFTCWWKPGSDGGLQTTYALYYLKDNSDALYECPDYHTAGENSCFFNKNETSIWVNYNITVVATNKMGRTISDPVDVDVAYIVQPHTPENVTVNVMEDKGWPYLRVSWESPHMADIRSGWITLVYELRSKIEGEQEWEEHFPGQQKTFNIFSVRPGRSYLVQVRCRPDHGFWSEWSSTNITKVPKYFLGERPLIVLIVVFCSLVLLTLAWIIHMNSHSLKHCILPPVPGPKIKGFDHQRLKNGSYKDGLSALMIPEYPPTSSSTYDDLLVEYLEVFVTEEQEPFMEEGKDLQDHYCKTEGSTCDSDSGHGSCDSHTLLIDKAKETNKDNLNSNCESGEFKKLDIGPNSQDEKMLSFHSSVDPTNERVKTWPSVFTHLPQYTSTPIPQKSSLEIVKQHCISDTLYRHGSLSSNLIDQNEPFGPSYWEFDLTNMPLPQVQPQTSKHLQAQSNIHISKQLTEVVSTQYVEVQKVHNKDMVLLQPVELNQSHVEGCSHANHKREDYSKVKGVNSDNMLLLENGVDATRLDTDMCLETNMLKKSAYTSTITGKHNNFPTQTTNLPVQEEQKVFAGYVDTAMFSVPMK